MITLAITVVLAGVVAPYLIALKQTLIPLGFEIGALCVVVFGMALLFLGIATRLKRDGIRKSTTGTKVGMAAVPVILFYLLLQGGALIYIGVTNSGEDLENFRKRQTYSNTPVKVAHPFLILTNNPAREPINSLGFLDREWPVEKRAGVVRIACLGASTSEDGYPQKLNEVLNAELNTPVEVMNFGNAYWTSAQTLINYSLNVDHFDPDIVIIHHGANELKTRTFREPRTDYSHAFGPLIKPRPKADAPLVAGYALYGILKMRVFEAKGVNAGISVDSAVGKPNPDPVPFSPEQLLPYRRNLEKIITMAEAKGRQVVLTTQPYSRENLSWSGQWIEHMSEINNVTRDIVESHPSLVLVDLDKATAMQEEIFTDPVHLTVEGMAKKVDLLKGPLAELIRAKSL